MARALPVLLAAASSLALAAPPPPLPTWFGIRASPAGSYDLVVMSDAAAIVSVTGPLALAPGETPLVDAMRCLPGFCVLAVSTADGASALYRVFNENATTQWRAACPGRPRG
jgi:hypothetical protein